MSGTIGKIFKITNWGESHGKAIGVIIDGCPSLLELNEECIQKDLDRRKPGQSSVTSQRKEDDKVEILSGVFNGKTTGTPISIIIKNKDVRKEDYNDISQVLRPGHADYTYQKKFGIRNYYGGGRSSARITAGNVAAGAIAKKILAKTGIEIIAYVKQVKDVKADVDIKRLHKEDVEASIVRCPDKDANEKMIQLIEDVKNKGDSVGGIIECVVKNVPLGLGQPIFDKLDADLAKAMMSINAAKGFEIGSGFRSIEKFGSQNNDEFVKKDGKILTKTNNSGGVLGGISNAMPIVFRVAFKPTPTIAKNQKTIDINGNETELKAKGRHDPCVLPRAVPVVEAMAAIVLADHYLRFKVSKVED